MIILRNSTLLPLLIILHIVTSKEFVTWVFCYKIVAFLKDSLSYSTNGRTLLLDCYFCCEVVLSWYWVYCNCCWTGCSTSPDPRAALTSVHLTKTRAGMVPSSSRRKHKLCRLPVAAKESVTESSVYSRPCTALCDISASQPLFLQAVLQPWPGCRTSGGSGHKGYTLLSSWAAWTVRPSLWDQAAANWEHSASLLTSHSPTLHDTVFVLGRL